MNMKFLWSLYAKVYDTINENVPYVRMLDQVIDELDILKQSTENIYVLDAGCGTGNIEGRLQQSQNNIAVLGIDSSIAMLERAKVKHRHNPRMKFQSVNLNDKIPFTNDLFNRVVSVNALYPLDHPEQALREFYRVLSSGGKLVFANPHDHTSFFAIMKGQYVALGAWRFIGKFFQRLPQLLIIIPVNIFGLPKNRNYWDENTTRTRLMEIGFRNIVIGRTYADQDLLVSATKG